MMFRRFGRPHVSISSSHLCHVQKPRRKSVGQRFRKEEEEEVGKEEAKEDLEPHAQKTYHFIPSKEKMTNGLLVGSDRLTPNYAKRNLPYHLPCSFALPALHKPLVVSAIFLVWASICAWVWP